MGRSHLEGFQRKEGAVFALKCQWILFCTGTISCLFNLKWLCLDHREMYFTSTKNKMAKEKEKDFHRPRINF